MGSLQTFVLPDAVSGQQPDVELGSALLRAWRRDGIFQVAIDPAQVRATAAAFDASRRFFAKPAAEKRARVSDLTYSGYVASGEERTAGAADYPEIFTVCRDFAPDHPRVLAQWPCHGPVPWPDAGFADAMRAFMAGLGSLGERVLSLTGLGLGLADPQALVRLTADGWHHLRVLRFPPASPRQARGIGAHTDYGLLVIAAQDEVGGLSIRPPVAGEVRRRNWLPGESSAGRHEHEDPWTFVDPVPDVVTVFPGDILQFLTGGDLLSTPHKVRLATRERHALAYFHEPAFDAVVRPLAADPGCGDTIHYGRHFTEMFMRSYPQRITTRRLIAEDRLARLAETA